MVSLASLTTYILRKYSSIPIVCKLSRNLFCLVLKALFGEGNGNPLQYSCLENPMDGGAWWATVHGVEKSRTRLSDFTFTFPFHALEKEMAIHSSVLAWRIPGTVEPGGLPSMGSHRVRHDWSNLAAAAAAAAARPDSLFGFLSGYFSICTPYPDQTRNLSIPQIYLLFS